MHRASPPVPARIGDPARHLRFIQGSDMSSNVPRWIDIAVLYLQCDVTTASTAREALADRRRDHQAMAYLKDINFFNITSMTVHGKK